MNNEHGIELLLNTIKRRYSLETDAELGELIGINRKSIGALRSGKKLGPTYILAIHEKIGMPVAQIRALYLTREPK